MDLMSKFNQSPDRSRQHQHNRRVSHINEIVWIQAGQVPPLYTQLAQFVTIDARISTPLLYRILESSNLSNDTLGAVWAICNQTAPGMLTMAELCACLSLVGLLQQDPTAKIDLNAVSSFPIVPQFDFDFSREHRVKLLAPPTASIQPHEIDEDDFGEFETYEIKPPNEPGFIDNSDKYSAIKETEPEQPDPDKQCAIKQTRNLMTLSTFDSFTAESISKGDELAKPVFSLSTINRLKTSTTPPPPPPNDNEEDFGEFEVAPAKMSETNKIEQKTNFTLDLTKAAQQLEKTKEKENMFDLLADLDFSAPPAQQISISEYAVTNQTQEEAKDAPLGNDTLSPPILSSSNAVINEIQQEAKGAPLVSVMSIDFTIVEPDSSTSVDTTDTPDAAVAEPVSWEIMNNNNAIDTEGTKSEKMDGLTVEFGQEDIDTSSDVEPETNDQMEQVIDQPTELVAHEPPKIESELAKPTQVSNHQKLCEHARSTWRRLVNECCIAIRQAVDLLGSVSETTIREVLEDRKGEAYLSDVCAFYLSAFRFNTALAQCHMANQADELAVLWADLQKLINPILREPLPVGRSRPLNRECKLCLHRCDEPGEYHRACGNMCRHFQLLPLPDFTRVTKL